MTQQMKHAGGRPAHYTKEQEMSVVALLMSGEKRTKIAAAVGVSVYTVDNIRRKSGVPPTRVGGGGNKKPDAA